MYIWFPIFKCRIGDNSKTWPEEIVSCKNTNDNKPTCFASSHSIYNSVFICAEGAKGLQKASG